MLPFATNAQVIVYDAGDGFDLAEVSRTENGLPFVGVLSGPSTSGELEVGYVLEFGGTAFGQYVPPTAQPADNGYFLVRGAYGALVTDELPASGGDLTLDYAVQLDVANLESSDFWMLRAYTSSGQLVTVASRFGNFANAGGSVMLPGNTLRLQLIARTDRNNEAIGFGQLSVTEGAVARLAAEPEFDNVDEVGVGPLAGPVVAAAGIIGR